MKSSDTGSLVQLLLINCFAVFVLAPGKVLGEGRVTEGPTLVRLRSTGEVYQQHITDFSTRPRYETRTRFLVSTDFSAQERKTVIEAIDFLAEEFRRHFKEYYKTNRDTSSYVRELARSYTKDVPPQSRDLTKKGHAADTMSVLALVTGNNSTSGNEIRIERFYERNTTWGRAGINPFIYGYGDQPDLETKLARLKGGRLEIRLNGYNVRRHNDRVNYWASTIFHEILHQCGYRHPTGYEGSLIKEAGLVVARRAKPRSDGFGLRNGRDFGYSIRE